MSAVKLTFGQSIDVTHWTVMPHRVLVKFGGNGWVAKMGWPFQDGWLIINRDGMMATYYRPHRVKPFLSETKPT